MFQFTTTLSSELCRANPKKWYVFGDNLIQKGKAGQAVIRDEPNAIGVPTKRLPSMAANAFFSDKEDEYVAVRKQLLYLWEKHKSGEVVVLPEQKIGSGLAKLWEFSPKIAKMVDNFYQAAQLSNKISKNVVDQNEFLFSRL